MSEFKGTPGPWIASFDYDGFPPDVVTKSRGQLEIICRVTANVPSIRITHKGEPNANACLIAAAPELKEVAEAYERWEADLILCGKAWNHGLATLPTITQPLWDRLIEIQAMRNAALQKAKGPPTP